MAQRTKLFYAEEVILSLKGQFPNRDMKIDPREVLLRLDEEVNEAAKAGYLLNMKLRLGSAIDDQFVTTWDNLTVTDPPNKAPSYIQLPANYVTLPDNTGIDQIYFMNDFTVAKTKYFDPVIITSFKDVSGYRNTTGEFLEERISCYPKNGYIYFDRGNINSKYGNIGIRLVVRDASAIADDAPYPIPAEYMGTVVKNLVQFYRERLMQPQDLVRDAVDKSIP